MVSLPTVSLWDLTVDHKDQAQHTNDIPRRDIGYTCLQ